jgi:hypothetical protein
VLQETVALARALNIPATAKGLEAEQQAAIAGLCGGEAIKRSQCNLVRVKMAQTRNFGHC